MQFHQEIDSLGYDHKVPHPIRERFWRLLPPREYAPTEGADYLRAYLTTVEREMSSIIGKHSIAYWLHAYRRLSPSAAGEQETPTTTIEARRILEAAIQKHGMADPCGGIGITGQIPLNKILNGFLEQSGGERMRELIEKSPPQLVLTDFSTPQLLELYDLERLAYEIWRSTAQLRILGKGAPLLVHEPPRCVSDLRSSELARLVQSFDAREEDFTASAKGVIFTNPRQSLKRSGWVLLPFYNVGKIPTECFSDFFRKAFKTSIEMSGSFNFVWFPFNMKDYRRAHLPLAGAFEAKYGVSLDSLLVTIAAIALRIQLSWNSRPEAIVTSWQRAYEGPITFSSFVDSLHPVAVATAKYLKAPRSTATVGEITKSLEFLTLAPERRKDIDLAFAGPHSVLLPYGRDRVFVDFAWIGSRLHHLFHQVSIADENFKGNALERIVRGGKWALPPTGCIAKDGTRKQIDGSFEVKDTLVIVECRAVAWSIGYSRGDPKAIDYRKRMIDKALSDIDEKTAWLIGHPVGRNYDISMRKWILPLVVTPFVEFIPSLNWRYWVRDDVPRVLTPAELQNALTSGILEKRSPNSVAVPQLGATR